jgi:hypothetical protein
MSDPFHRTVPRLCTSPQRGVHTPCPVVHTLVWTAILAAEVLPAYRARVVLISIPARELSRVIRGISELSGVAVTVSNMCLTRCGCQVGSRCVRGVSARSGVATAGVVTIGVAISGVSTTSFVVAPRRGVVRA